MRPDGEDANGESEPVLDAHGPGPRECQGVEEAKCPLRHRQETGLRVHAFLAVGRMGEAKEGCAKFEGAQDLAGTRLERDQARPRASRDRVHRELAVDKGPLVVREVARGRRQHERGAGPGPLGDDLPGLRVDQAETIDGGTAGR